MHMRSYIHPFNAQQFTFWPLFFCTHQYIRLYIAYTCESISVSLFAAISLHIHVQRLCQGSHASFFFVRGPFFACKGYALSSTFSCSQYNNMKSVESYRMVVRLHIFIQYSAFSICTIFESANVEMGLKSRVHCIIISHWKVIENRLMVKLRYYDEQPACQIVMR